LLKIKVPRRAEFAFVGVATTDSALKLKEVANGTYLHTRKILVDFADKQLGKDTPRVTFKRSESSADDQSLKSLFIIGLPYSCSEKNIADELGISVDYVGFHNYDNSSKRHAGRAIVRFESEQDAIQALGKIESNYLCGRKCVATFAKKQIERTVEHPKNFKERRLTEKKEYDPKDSLLYTTVGNAMLNAEALLKKDESILRNLDAAPVIAAVSEADLKSKTLNWLVKLGLNEDMFQVGNFRGKKGNRTLMLKNLPLHTDFDELRHPGVPQHQLPRS